MTIFKSPTWVEKLGLRTPRGRRPASRRPLLEHLEDRLVPAFATTQFLETPIASHDVPLAEHFHPHLHVIIDGVEHVIPGDVNIVEPPNPIINQGVAQGLYPIHTHVEDLQQNPPDTGRLHVEATEAVDFHLGDFFTLWSLTSGSPKIFNSQEIKFTDNNGNDIDFKADATHAISMTVDGQSNSDFENFVLTDPHSSLPGDPGPNIVVTATTLSPPPVIVANGTNEGYVSQLYRDVLHRTPEPAGMALWSNVLNAGGMTREQVALLIEIGPEARTGQVGDIYQTLLHRVPDPGGQSASIQFLAGGGTQEQLRAIVSASDEYFQTRGGGTNAGFLSALYEDALGRPIDADAQTALTNALNAGTSRLQIAQAVYGSAEYQTDLVQKLYQQYLHRAPDPAGQAAFVDAVMQGWQDEQVVVALTSSDEFFAG